MTLIIIVPLIAAITSALLFIVLDERPLKTKLAELGKLAFVAAFVALMFALGGSQIRLG